MQKHDSYVSNLLRLGIEKKYIYINVPQND